MKPLNIVMSLITGVVFIVGAIVGINVFIAPSTFVDMSIRQGKGTSATAVVIGYNRTGSVRTGNINTKSLFALELLINSADNGTFKATTDGAFSYSEIQRLGIRDGHEPEVNVRYIGTRAVVDGQPSSFPTGLVILIFFGLFGILIIVATIYNAVTGKQLISNEFVERLSRRFHR